MRLPLVVTAATILLGVAPAQLAASPLPDSSCSGQTGVNPGGSTVYTFSCSETQVLTSTFAANSTSSYLTTIMAEIGSGGSLFDQTFDAPYNSSIV